MNKRVYKSHWKAAEQRYILNTGSLWNSSKDMKTDKKGTERKETTGKGSRTITDNERTEEIVVTAWEAREEEKTEKSPGIT
jgi:hypothetical protein